MPMSFRALSERFRNVLHFDDSPGRLALSLAVGVFISFTPFYGLQTLLSLGVAVILRLNRAATVAGAWINLPWFAPLVYGAALKLGAAILPGEGLRGLSLALLVGSTLLGTVAALITYLVALGAISRRRSRTAGPANGARRVSWSEGHDEAPPPESR